MGGKVDLEKLRAQLARAHRDDDWVHAKLRTVIAMADELAAARACIARVQDFYDNHEILGWGGHEGVGAALAAYNAEVGA